MKKEAPEIARLRERGRERCAGLSRGGYLAVRSSSNGADSREVRQVQETTSAEAAVTCWTESALDYYSDGGRHRKRHLQVSNVICKKRHVIPVCRDSMLLLSEPSRLTTTLLCVCSFYNVHALLQLIVFCKHNAPFNTIYIQCSYSHHKTTAHKHFTQGLGPLWSGHLGQKKVS